MCNFKIRTSPVPLQHSAKCVCRDDCWTLLSLQQAASVQQVLQSGGVSICILVLGNFDMTVLLQQRLSMHACRLFTN